MKKVIACISKSCKSTRDLLIKVIRNQTQCLAYLEDLEKMNTIIENNLSQLIEMDNEKKGKINDDIKKMIPYYVHLTDQVETRRARFLESSWQTLTILIAASGFLIFIKLSPLLLYPSLIVFSIQIFFAVCKLIEFQAQTGFHYPFIDSKFGNKWKWFYYANPYVNTINPSPFQKRQFLKENLIPYLKGLNLFLENYIMETIDKELVENIQQLYLLQVHNFYKNKYYLRLNKYDFWANRISFTIVTIYLGILLGYLIYYYII